MNLPDLIAEAREIEHSLSPAPKADPVIDRALNAMGSLILAAYEANSALAALRTYDPRESLAEAMQACNGGEL